jgi:hypothetical protein
MPDDESAIQPNENTETAKKFIVDGIFPRNLVHLIAAPVATGKTTLFMQQIHAMQHGLDFLTKRAFDTRIVYITADRGRQETDATLARLGLTGIVINLLSLKDMRGTIPYLEIMIGEHCKHGDLVIVEPLNFFLRDSNNKPGDINNFGQVSNFLLRLGRIAEDMQITIEGSLHSSKAKQGAQYMVAREKVIGSVAWTAFTATTVVLEPADPTVCDDPGRLIHVLPRDIRPFTLDYVVEPTHGLLVPSTAKPFKSRLDELLEAHEGQFTTEHLELWMEEAHVSLPTLKRWLKQKIDDGYVERIGRGTYQKRPRN